MKAVQNLIAEALRSAECRDARAAWVRRTSDRWLKEHLEVDDRLTEAVVRLSEEEFDRLADAELGRVDALMAQIRAAIDEDKWPKELYLSAM